MNNSILNFEIKSHDLISYDVGVEKGETVIYGIVYSCKLEGIKDKSKLCVSQYDYNIWYDLVIISEGRLISLIINSINICKLKKIQ
jgi:hypothetical protein